MFNPNKPQMSNELIKNESDALKYYDIIRQMNKLDWGEEPTEEQIKEADTIIERIMKSDDEEIKSIIPEEQKNYYMDNHLKHFVPDTAIGSLFKEASDLQELLALAKEQRGNLEGDDKEKFIEKGASPEGLLPFCRYIYVETKGEVGIVKLSDLDDNTQVNVVRTKEGAPCSLVVTGDDLPEANFGTIIIGPNQKEKPESPEPSTKEMIWTVHPGLPVRPATEDLWTEGSTITAGEIKNKLQEKLGDINSVYLNIKKEK